MQRQCRDKVRAIGGRCLWAAGVAVFAFSLAGCSIFMRGNPKDWTPYRAPTCTKSYVLPAIDTALLVTFGAVVPFLALTAERHPENDGPGGDLAAVMSLYVAAPFLLAAPFGWWRAQRCRRAITRHRDKLGAWASPYGR